MKKKRVKSLRNIVVAAIVVIFAVSLGACGSSGTGTGTGGGSADKTPAPATSGGSAPATSGGSSAVGAGMVDTSAFKTDKATKDIYIGFSEFNTVNTWRVQNDREIQYHAQELGIKLDTTNANSDPAKQVSDVQDLLAKGIDALVINAGSPTAMANAMKQCIAAGVPVILENSEVDDQTSYTGYVGTKAEDFGYTISTWLLDKLGNKGKIVVVDGIAGNSVSVLRHNGLQKALDELPDKGAGIEILNTYYGDWAYDKGKQIGEQMLAAYPQIDGVWSQGGAMSQGIVEAFQAANRPLVPITGEDSNGFLKMWANLKPQGFTSIAAADPTWQSAYALDVAMKALKGEPIKKLDYIEIPVITDDTLANYVKPNYSDAYWCNTHLPASYADKYYLNNGSN